MATSSSPRRGVDCWTDEWVLEDPAGLDLVATRPIRDEIERRVRALLDEIGATALHSTRC